MDKTITHNEFNMVIINNRNYDPTNTLFLRNAFASAMNKRFNELENIINKAIVEQDVFGLEKTEIEVNQMYSPGQEAFAFSRDSAKLAAFEKWLQEQIDKGILEVVELQQVGESVESAWTNRYIADSYKRGIIRARYELRKAGIKDIPSIEETGGIEMSMNSPFHLDRVGLLFTRTYLDLKGITIAMDNQISRILAQGLADGDSPRLLARKLVSVINGKGIGDLGITDSLGRFIPAKRRAEILARTEIIRAHHSAMIQEYRNWRLEGVIVKAEFVTAGDERVCSRCASLQGEIFTLEKIENLIPVHPQCRCIALPYILK